MEWTNVAVYAGIFIGIGCSMLLVSHLLGPRRFQVEKMDPYECGVPLLSGSRERFPVQYYLVAILFILFDIETVFLIPWAVLYRKLGVPGLGEVGIFIAVLGFGLAYMWKRGALEWD